MLSTLVSYNSVTGFCNDLSLRDGRVLKQQQLISVPVVMMVARGVVRMRLAAMKCQSRVTRTKQIKT